MRVACTVGEIELVLFVVSDNDNGAIGYIGRGIHSLRSEIDRQYRRVVVLVAPGNLPAVRSELLESHGSTNSR